jgi:DNA-binding transcriptional ArsR family regulator
MVQVNKRAGEKAETGGSRVVDGSPASGDGTPACCAGLQELLSPQLFKALADPRRLSLLVRLAEAGGPCTVGRLAEGSGVDLSVVSRHLAVLREAGIITCTKQGKEVWCAVQTGAVVKILRDLADGLETCCPLPGGADKGGADEATAAP